jgi:hypothetical protein
MFVANFRLKTAVQRWMVSAWDCFEYPKFHPSRMLREEALRETVCYIKNYLPDVVGMESAKEVLLTGLEQVSVCGEYLEFGVFKGGTIKFIANRVRPKVVHGFDAFEGLPEPWTGNPFNFNVGGRLPRVPKNVRLHEGWFSETLPVWAEKHTNPIAFLHIDSDLYESAKCVLGYLEDRIVPGTVVVCDEYFNYPNWREHEFRAWQEFVVRRDVKYRYLAYAKNQVAMLVSSLGR